MSIKMIGVYGGVFVGMLILALFTTGTFQRGILPRLSGHGASESAGEGAPGAAAEAGPKTPLPATTAQDPATTAQNPATATPPVPVAEAPHAPPANTADGATPVRREAVPGIEAGKEAQVQRLARIYEGMRPKEAAVVLEKIERPLATQVLHGIKERQTAKILAAMNPTVAAELTRLLGQVGESVAP
jgi:hypothetical protein